MARASWLFRELYAKMNKLSLENIEWILSYRFINSIWSSVRREFQLNLLFRKYSLTQLNYQSISMFIPSNNMTVCMGIGYSITPEKQFLLKDLPQV